MKPVSSGRRSTPKPSRLSVVLGMLAFPAIVLTVLLSWHRMRAVASENRTDAIETAQAAETLCRQVFRERLDGLVIYEEPNPFSRAIGGLSVNQQVTLAPDFVNILGEDGQNWIEIVAPVRGYISNGFSGGTSNLVYCSVPAATLQAPVEEFGTLPGNRRDGTIIDRSVVPGEQPGTLVVEEVIAENFCRRAIEEEGLAVRRAPSPFADRVGGVGFNEEVQLESLVKIRGPEGRVWVPIVYPAPGFISHGYGEEPGNLAYCLQ
ncbi:MAG: SH3 domain-containing protein [Cyanobacteriota bacterium]|nr:SH3 domain-containing protein [Cyanobacteriota bacterium]